MAVSNIKAIFENDIHKVWDIVFAVDKYSSWRSDLSKTEIINEKQFIEYTKDGYATTFSITAVEPYRRAEFQHKDIRYYIYAGSKHYPGHAEQGNYSYGVFNQKGAGKHHIHTFSHHASDYGNTGIYGIFYGSQGYAVIAGRRQPVNRNHSRKDCKNNAHRPACNAAHKSGYPSQLYSGERLDKKTCTVITRIMGMTKEARLLPG